MIQSISMREYDPTIFEDISIVGLMNTHHASSNVYSSALAKTGAKYTVGLSATPKTIRWFRKCDTLVCW